jgi:hypothetical protein
MFSRKKQAIPFDFCKKFFKGPKVAKIQKGDYNKATEADTYFIGRKRI